MHTVSAGKPAEESLKMKFRNRQRGLTLMELLKTMGIVSIVLSFGVPSMTSLVRGNQVVTYVNEIVSTVHAARTQAVYSVVQITVCKSVDQLSCSNAASWNDGWIAFADANENEIRNVDGVPEALIYAHPALDRTFTLQSEAFDDWIAFRPNGRTIGSVANTGTFSLCSDSGTRYGRDINISRTGSPLAGESADGACP
jgi:type IV fimbrial biogenesis protein FimT